MLCRLCSISCSHALTQPVFWRLARRMSSSGRARRWLTCTTYYPSTLSLRGSPTHLAPHCHQCIRCEPKLHGPSTCRLRLAWRNASRTALRITVAACLLTIGSRRDTSKAARSLAAALRRAACPSRRATILRSPSGQLPGFTPNEHLNNSQRSDATGTRCPTGVSVHYWCECALGCERLLCEVCAGA